MKTALRVCIVCLLTVLIPALSRPQDQVTSEVPYVFENGTLKCTRVVVAFNENVLSTHRGTTIVDTMRYPVQDRDVRELIRKLAERYGPMSIRKTFPNSIWGDTVAVNKRTGRASRAPDLSQNFTLDFESPVPVDSVISAFEQIRTVRFADHPITVRTLTDPNDPYFGSQWYLQTIQAPQAWNISIGSAAKRIAIIDVSGGYQVQDHPDFQLPGGGNKFVGGDGSRGKNHAIHVAGIAGAATNNNLGVSSLGWSTSLLGYYFNDQSDYETQFRLPQLIDLASDPNDGNADVLNFSFETLRLGSGSKHCPHDYPEIQQIIAVAVARGAVLVAAAGNANIVGCPDGQVPYVAYPAAYDDVIAVSGTKATDVFFDTYNYGDFVDVAAPAENIWGPWPPSTYTTQSGTSGAAPLVSALSALILAVNPSANVEGIIKSTTDKVDSIRFPYVDGRNDHLGYGRINAYKSLAMANGAPLPPQSLQVQAYNNNPRLTWSANTEPDLASAPYKLYRRISILGGGVFQDWIVKATVSGTSYVDADIGILPKPYIYRVYYKLTASDVVNQESNFSNQVSIDAHSLLWKPDESQDEEQKPIAYALDEGFPNPFNPSTTIRYALPERSYVTLTLFNTLGQLVATLVEGEMEAGDHEVKFDARDLSSGVYLYRLTAGEFVQTRKLVLSK